MWQYPEDHLKMSGCRTINIANQEHWQFVPLSLHRQNKHMELYGRCDRWRVSHGSLFSAMCAGSYFAKCTGNIVKVGMDFSGSDDTIQTIHGLGRDVDCSLYTRTVINKCWVRGFQPQQRVWLSLFEVLIGLKALTLVLKCDAFGTISVSSVYFWNIYGFKK